MRHSVAIGISPTWTTGPLSGGGDGPQNYTGTIHEVNSDGGSAATGILFRDEDNNYWTGDADGRYTTFSAALTAATAGDTIVVTKADDYGNITINKECKLYAAEGIDSHGFVSITGDHMASFVNITVTADCTIAGVCCVTTSAAITVTSASVTVARCNFWVNGDVGIRLAGTAPEVTSRANVFYCQGTNGRCFQIQTADATLTSRSDTASTFNTNATAAVDRTGFEGATVDVQGMIALGTWTGDAFEQGTADDWGDSDYNVTTDTSAPGGNSSTSIVLADYMARIDGGGSVFYPMSDAEYGNYESGTAVPFTNDGRARTNDHAGALESLGFQNPFDTDIAEFDTEIISGSNAVAIRSSAYLSLIGAGESVAWAKTANYDPSGKTRIAFFARSKADAGGGGEQNPAFWLSAAESGDLYDNGYRIELGRNGPSVTRYNDGVATTVYSSGSYAMGSSIRNCYCHVLVNGDGVHFRFVAGGVVPVVVDTDGDRHTAFTRAGFGIRSTAGGTPRMYQGTLA